MLVVFILLHSYLVECVSCLTCDKLVQYAVAMMIIFKQTKIVDMDIRSKIERGKIFTEQFHFLTNIFGC